MDIQEIYGLMDHFDGSSLSRMKLEMGELKLTLEKGTVGSGENTVNASPVTGSKNLEANEKSGEEEEVIKVRAPFVGTFYRASSPEEKPFVNAGQPVKKGEVIGIIEAMKMMNEIVAPQDGVVVAILAEDGAMVEYNQVLMTLK